MIELFEDRLARPTKDYQKRVFLKAGVYPDSREIKGVGWLVYTNLDLRKPQMTIIRYGQGEEV
jgi:hypothetical protein